MNRYHEDFAWRALPRIPTVAGKMAFLALCRFAGPTGVSYATLSQLMKVTGMSERGLQGGFKVLIERGLIERKVNPGQRTETRIISK